MPTASDLLHEPVLRWYADHARDLPWRAPAATPWGVLVSEVMLQQTPVARVLPVWQEWMQRWPVPGDLAAAPPADAVRHWGRLGYPRRALRLHAAAVAVRDRHSGALPDDHEALLALPGVGSYTAAAVAAFAFGRRHAVVDTNVRRVHARAVTGVAAAAPALTVAETRLAASLLPAAPARAARWSVAVMELGALVCTARSPGCDRCPLEPTCAWVSAGRPASTGAGRRPQTWTGSDRQARGRILSALRSAPGCLPATVLLSAARGLPSAAAPCPPPPRPPILIPDPDAGPVAIPADGPGPALLEAARTAAGGRAAVDGVGPAGDVSATEQTEQTKQTKQTKQAEQARRCLASLAADGLVEPCPDRSCAGAGCWRLPAGTS